MKLSTIILYVVFLALLFIETKPFGGTLTFAFLMAVQLIVFAFVAAITEEETIFKGRFKWLEKNCL